MSSSSLLGALARGLGFVDAPGYLALEHTPFVPPAYTIAQIHAAVPAHLRRPGSTLKSAAYAAQTAGFVALFFACGAYIDGLAPALAAAMPVPVPAPIVRWTLWAAYWWWQGLAFAGCFTFGHEAAHGALSPHKWANTLFGFPLMTFVMVPYHGWQASHANHHKHVNDLDRDESYVPRTRAQLGLPPLPSAPAAAPGATSLGVDADADADAADMEAHDQNASAWAEAPLCELGWMLFMQFAGIPLFFLFNAEGHPRYPAWTNHFNPRSALFRPRQRAGIIITDIALLANAFALYYAFRPFGIGAFVRLYLVPYFIANHWIVLLTYLNHTCPLVPHYRGASWSFVRAGLATVDRPLLGWAGRVFLHNVAHDHVAHHFFSRTPFYNQPQVTAHLRALLGADYRCDMTPAHRAMFRSFTRCRWVDADGEIVFWRDRRGRSYRWLAEEKDEGKKVGVEGTKLEGGGY